MEFNKFDLTDKVVQRTYKSFLQSLDTEDYVEPKYNDFIAKHYFGLMKKSVKDVNIYALLDLEKRGVKLGLWKRFKIWWSGLRPIWNMEQQELKQKQEETAKKKLERQQQKEKEERLAKRKKRKKKRKSTTEDVQ